MERKAKLFLAKSRRPLKAKAKDEQVGHSSFRKSRIIWKSFIQTPKRIYILATISSRTKARTNSNAQKGIYWITQNDSLIKGIQLNAEQFDKLSNQAEKASKFFEDESAIHKDYQGHCQTIQETFASLEKFNIPEQKGVQEAP